MLQFKIYYFKINFNFKFENEALLETFTKINLERQVVLDFLKFNEIA